jgi:hypothetical protein
MTCDYCGRKNEKISFMIGASRKAEWTMWEGTGKISCHDLGCWQRGELESKESVRRHAETHVDVGNKFRR